MDSEYVGAYGYMPIVYIAPQFAARELKDVPAIVHDEFTHGTRIRDVLNMIGFDADRWVENHQHDYSFRIRQGEKLSAKRPTMDFRVNIFYYDLVVPKNELMTWINFGLFQFLQDRGAGEQLRDTLDSSFAPWARENGKTMSEENKHIRHGDMWMARLFQNYPEFIQQQFDLWWPRSLATFGRPESRHNDLWRKLGLKRRTNEEVVRAFLDRSEAPFGLQIANQTVGLEILTTEEVLTMWRQSTVPGKV
ncbi:MAG: phenylacetate-CoA oxygenase subunit PaaI [Candidatus Sungbacteria bacterium]|nr:phenylacetate-CoA oxygenase subunit PaaI [Candidatus Sungbacteria bacterium]